MKKEKKNKYLILHILIKKIKIKILLLQNIKFGVIFYLI
jgi:hypothetical protein